MQIEFSITNIKAKDVLQVCDAIRGATNVKVEEYILDAIQKNDVEQLIASLNAINYLAFRSILILNSEKNALKEKLSQFNN